MHTISKILVLGDTHFPFAHRKAFDWVYRLADKFKPTHVVQVGDLLDQFAFSRYPKVLKMSPEEELARGRLAAEKMWKTVNCGNKIQLVGNHCVRLTKTAVSVAPQLAHLVDKSFRELYSFNGVKTVFNPTEEFKLGGIIFQHGHRSKLGDHARYNLCNTVCGHSHRGGVVFDQSARGPFWELNVGFLGDIESPVFGYRAQKHIHKTTVGVGLIDELGPRFVPYTGK